MARAKIRLAADERIGRACEQVGLSALRAKPIVAGGDQHHQLVVGEIVSNIVVATAMKRQPASSR